MESEAVAKRGPRRRGGRLPRSGLLRIALHSALSVQDLLSNPRGSSRRPFSWLDYTPPNEIRWNPRATALPDRMDRRELFQGGLKGLYDVGGHDVRVGQVVD